MKPYQVLIFVAGTMLILLVMAAVFPADGLKIAGSYKLRFITVDGIFSKDSANYADISEIISLSNAITEEPSLPDSLTQTVDSTTSTSAKTIPVKADSLRAVSHPILFPPDNPELLYKVFAKLRGAARSGSMVRILHYGDSQIEADRMTSFLRNKLQQSFGGGGCGLVPAVPLYSGILSLRQEQSDNWLRYTGFANQDTTLGHARYGALFAFSGYGSATDSLGGQTAWINYRLQKAGYQLARQFNRVSLFMGGDTDSLGISILLNDTLFDAILLSELEDYTRIAWTVHETPVKIRLEFEGRESPEIYGISFDKVPGIAVDNIPLRGSAGLVFSATDTSLLKRMYKELNVGLILLQFGGNVVPHQTDSYTYYERLLKREIKILKTICPGVPAIFIGPSDMSVKVGGKYVTYPNLERVRDAVKKAALESGYAFWDMYEAMGGYNSMPSWVMADPPLAVTDYVHFNEKGATIVSEMFYNSFIFEYNRWLGQSTQEAKQLATHP
jgi:lysophospholipase L1-like esterase